MKHPEAAELLAAALERHWRSRSRTVTVTWLNHHSAPRCLEHEAADLRKMDYIGVDGILLRALSGSAARTSADLVLPLLLPRLTGARVAVIGSTPDHLNAAAAAVASLLDPTAQVVGAVDGYGGLPRGADLARWLDQVRPDVVVAGLGSGLQERFLVEAAEHLPHGLLVTCGGWLDQVTSPGYYPAWAYPLRLNWAVRLAREPRRLWRRYTVDAGRAVLAAPRLRTGVRSQPGWRRAEELVAARCSGLDAERGESV